MNGSFFHSPNLDLIGFCLSGSPVATPLLGPLLVALSILVRTVILLGQALTNDPTLP